MSTLAQGERSRSWRSWGCPSPPTSTGAGVVRTDRRVSATGPRGPTALVRASVLSSSHRSAGVMATLRQLRERNALAQRDLARLAGMSVNTVLDLEKGRRRPRPSTRRKLAKALNVPPHEIDFSL